MLLNKFNIFFILFILSCSCVTGQDAKVDLKKINEAYAFSKAFSMTLSYNLYSTHSSQKPFERQTGTIKKSGDKFYASYFSSEVIKTESLKCFIDHNSKSIIIDEFTPTFKKPEMVLPDMSQALSECSAVVFKDLGNTRAMYTFSFEDYIYSKMELVFNKKTYLVEKMVYYYTDEVKLGESKLSAKPKLELICSNINIKPSFKNEDFSITKYVKKVKNQFLPQSSFSNYQVISH